MSIKVTKNQENAIKGVLATLKEENLLQTELNATMSKDNPESAKNHDVMASIAFYVQRRFRKYGTKQLDQYFAWNVLEAAKKNDASKNTKDMKTLIKCQMVRKAMEIACDYDPLTKKTVLLKGSKSQEEIRKGESNIEGMKSWFIKKEKNYPTTISLSPEELEEQA